MGLQVVMFIDSFIDEVAEVRNV